jgi:hypothetical protein
MIGVKIGNKFLTYILWTSNAQFLAWFLLFKNSYLTIYLIFGLGKYFSLLMKVRKEKYLFSEKTFLFNIYLIFGLGKYFSLLMK